MSPRGYKKMALLTEAESTKYIYEGCVWCMSSVENGDETGGVIMWRIDEDGRKETTGWTCRTGETVCALMQRTPSWKNWRNFRLAYGASRRTDDPPTRVQWVDEATMEHIETATIQAFFPGVAWNEGEQLFLLISKLGDEGTAIQNVGDYSDEARRIQSTTRIQLRALYPLPAPEGYETVDRKTDLLIERMSECVRFVQEYMRYRTAEQNMGDRVVFGVMLRDFEPCIERLKEIQQKMRRAVLETWPLQMQRATELRRACSMVYTFHNNSGRNVRIPALSHIENEMQNMIRIEQNLYPEESLFGFTNLNKGGVLMKIIRDRGDAQGVVKTEVVVVSETAYQTECAVCYDREREVVLYPCTHCCLCKRCKESVFIGCPICRAPIVSSRPLGEVQFHKLPFLMSSQFPGSEGHLPSLLDRLQQLT